MRGAVPNKNHEVLLNVNMRVDMREAVQDHCYIVTHKPCIDQL